MAGKKSHETLELGVKSAKVASLVALTQVVSIIVSGLNVVLLARLLQPAPYGIYTLAYSVSILFSAFGMSGIGHYLNKYIPVWIARKKKDELEKDLGTSFVALFIICAIAVLLGLAFSGFIAVHVFHSISYVGLIDLALLSILFTPMMYLAYNALIGFKDGVGGAVTYSASNVAIAVASVGLVALYHEPIDAIAGIIIGSLFGLLVGIAFILRHSAIRFSFSDAGRRIRYILVFSLPVAGSTIISVAMNNVSVLFLGALTSATLVGTFGVAYRIGTIIVTVIQFIGSVLVQMFASALESRKSATKIGKLYNYSVYFGFVLTVPIAAYLIVLSRAFASILFPTQPGSVLYTPAVVVSLLVGMIGIYASSLAISESEVRRVLRYAVITGIVQFALMLLLVPLISAYGVIISVYLGGSIVGNYLYMRYMKRKLGISTELGKVYKTTLIGLVLVVVLLPIALFVRGSLTQLILGVIAIMVVYPPLLGLSGAMGESELKILRAIGSGTPSFGSLVNLLATYVTIFRR